MPEKLQGKANRHDLVFLNERLQELLLLLLLFSFPSQSMAVGKPVVSKRGATKLSALGQKNGNEKGRAAVAPHFTERTLDLWQQRTSQKLTAENAREMAANVSGFFRLLAAWDRERQQE